MFDFVTNRRYIVRLILAAIMLPFAFFGVDYYFRGADSADQVAKVAGSRITLPEYGQALRRQQDQLRQMLKGQADQSMLDSPELRRQVLDQLIEDRLSYGAALGSGLVVSDDELRQFIAEMAPFKDETGKFSAARYEEVLRAQGMSTAGFESALRKDRTLATARALYAQAAYAPDAVVDRLYRLRMQRREVAEVSITPAQYLSQVKVDAAEIKAYYDAHKSEMQTPERLRAEYVVLSLEGVQKSITVTDEEVAQYFKEHAAQFTAAEERKASHILVVVAAGAGADARAKARDKAAALVQQARANPAAFADLAKKNSEDPGSAADGGDLGYFPRGRMAKAFDAAVFGMKVGDITGPVETQFGYHVIKLDAVRGGEAPRFEAVKGRIEEELRHSRAGRRFAEAAESLNNMAFEQPESLKPAADALKLPVQQSGWLTRKGGDLPLLSNEKLLKALFGDEAVKRKHNTEAVEVSANVMVAARVLEYQAATPRALPEVEAEIRQRLASEKAAALVRKDGEARLAALRKGETPALAWGATETVTRDRPGAFAPEVQEGLFRLDVAKLPAYGGAVTSDGRYVLYRVSKVIETDKVDATDRKRFGRQLSEIESRELINAWLASLRARADVKIDARKLEKSGA